MEKIMEALHGIWLKIIDLVFWQTLINHFRWVDWITIGFVFFGLFIGVRKGLMRMLAEIMEMILILAVTFAFQPSVAIFLKSYLPSVSEKTLAPFAFMITAFCIWFVVAVIDKYAQMWLHAKIPGFLKTAGGALAGMFQLFLLWSFLSQAILMVPIAGAHKIYDAGKSTFGVYVKNFAPSVYRTISNPGQILPKRG